MTIFEQMVQGYAINSENDRRNAVYEVMQQIALAGLQRGGFFEKAAFYGGTCLRIFHGLERFSEDMDFSLVNKNEDFHFEDYFPSIVNEFKSAGLDVVIFKKQKKNFGKVESAFLKEDTSVYDLKFKSMKSIKIKIEVDTDPPLSFETESKFSLMPFSFATRCFTLPCLFAGKMHALIFRNWKQRVKGRDWYDFEWYVRKGVALDFSHFQARCSEFSKIDMDKELFFKMLKEKLATTDIKMVKAGVLPFVKNPKSLDIWSNDYFVQLADMIKFK
ncbi:MAG: nucleotidyl transferase AbiEii/AbiGii toxin family protein [Fibrobacter sp.]|nr:nucleotidyl transferase AbiEii/AbiGii toxin family protein [Fibrobacter sp.]